MIRRDRPAMATWFQVWLDGPDPDHLVAVADAALDEVTRAERLLSRFDPAAELARVNREAVARPVRVSPSLMAVLLDCRRWWELTEGYFDPCHGGPAPFGEALAIDENAGTIRFLDPATRVDLGGYGKGYALDRAVRIIDEFGVRSAFLQGGTSSAVARGSEPDGGPWTVAVRDPFLVEPTTIGRLRIVNQGLSSSAVFAVDGGPSDVIDPVRGGALTEQAAVSVVAATAAEAEVYSTALLAMGRTRMDRFLDRTRPSPFVAWFDRDVVIACYPGKSGEGLSP